MPDRELGIDLSPKVSIIFAKGSFASLKTLYISPARPCIFTTTAVSVLVTSCNEKSSRPYLHKRTFKTQRPIQRTSETPPCQESRHNVFQGPLTIGQTVTVVCNCYYEVNIISLARPTTRFQAQRNPVGTQCILQSDCLIPKLNGEVVYGFQLLHARGYHGGIILLMINRSLEQSDTAVNNPRNRTVTS